MTIHINERFEIRPDRYCWILVEHIPTDPSRKNTKYESREYHTFHGTVAQACTTLLSRCGDDCDTAQGLVREWQKAVTAIREAISEREAA